LERALLDHVTPPEPPEATTFCSLVLASHVVTVFHPRRQQIKAFPQTVKSPCSSHTNSPRQKTRGPPTSHWPTSKTRNTVVPRSLHPLLPLADRPRGSVRRVLCGTTVFPRSGLRYRFGMICIVHMIARVSFVRFLPSFKLGSLLSIHSPFDLDFALEFFRTDPHPRRHCARRRAPHDDSIKSSVFETRFSLHMMPRGLSPAADVRLLFLFSYSLPHIE